MSVIVECEDPVQAELAKLRCDLNATTFTFMAVLIIVVFMLCRLTTILNHISRELEFGNHMSSLSDCRGMGKPSASSAPIAQYPLPWERDEDP